MSTFDVDGTTLWYDEVGAGELMVLLHGGLGLDHTCFRPWLDPLSDGLRVVFTDFRANGRSGGDGLDLTMARLVEDVEALRDHLGADRTWLLGHSYGGFVALEHALRHPDRLHGIVLVDTDSRAPSGDSMVRELGRLGMDVEQAMSAFAAPLETTEDALRLFEVLGPAYFPHSRPETGLEVMSSTIFRKEGSDGGSRALEGWDVTDRLREVAVRTLVIGGADDFMFPRSAVERLTAGIPGAEAVVVDGAGHLPFVEQQDVVVDAVRAFVRGG